MNGKPAVILLSGGLDIATTLAIAGDAGYACHALSFDYGQRHIVELQAARRVAAYLHAASHRWVRINLRDLIDDRLSAAETSGGTPPRFETDGQQFRKSALIHEIDVPKDREEAEMESGIPVTYVPARNTIFLSYGLAVAEMLRATDLFIGVNAIDYSGYPDCRPEYIRAFEAMANLATAAAVEGRKLTLHTPLIDMPKTKIVERGLELGVDYGMTHSCYDPGHAGRPCTRCDACLLRQRAFEHLGLKDPLLKL